MAPPCPEYRPEPVGLHPWVEGVCQFWGRCGCIVDGRTCYWEGRPPEEEDDVDARAVLTV